VEKGGEPAGTWGGNGVADLGFGDGDTVRREGFEPLYGQFLEKSCSLSLATAPSS
jgi:hypothetical protein